MIALILFFVISFALIYSLWRLNRIPSNSTLLFLKFIFFLFLGTQFWAIFQHGTQTAGVAARIPFFEAFIVCTMNLPNPTIQWASLFFFILTLVFCLPKRVIK
ncbi:hypothetical protein SAMN05444724_3093 [Salinivibrio sp. ES.052]|nr:hypothetical protein SAMN05444724_3093 [Salinivibrio sp. ES.052]